VGAYSLVGVMEVALPARKGSRPYPAATVPLPPFLESGFCSLLDVRIVIQLRLYPEKGAGDWRTTVFWRWAGELGLSVLTRCFTNSWTPFSNVKHGIMPCPGWLAIEWFADSVNLDLASVFRDRKAGTCNYLNQIK
jgi:hypothetical protein